MKRIGGWTHSSNDLLGCSGFVWCFGFGVWGRVVWWWEEGSAGQSVRAGGDGMDGWVDGWMEPSIDPPMAAIYPHKQAATRATTHLPLLVVEKRGEDVLRGRVA